MDDLQAAPRAAAMLERFDNQRIPNMAQTLAQITKQIKQLQKEADVLRQAELRGVVDRIKVAISHYGLTADQLGFGKPAVKTATVAKPASKTSRKAAAPLFSNEKNQVWSGRGPRPLWLREALATGRSLDEFSVGAKSRAAKPLATAAQSAAPSTVTPQAAPKAVTKRAKARSPKPTVATEPIAGAESVPAQDVAVSVAAPKSKRQTKTTPAKSPKAKKSLANKIASVAANKAPRPKSKRLNAVSAAANKTATALNAETSDAPSAELAEA